MDQNLTELLIAAQQGDGDARERAIQLVYRELHRMASKQIRLERPNHTLQPTALVHETYVKLFDGLPIELKSRYQFYSIASTQMRRILVDHARKKKAQKRTADDSSIVIGHFYGQSSLTADDLLTLDLVLTRFKREYPRAGSIVEMRFFCGMTEEETANVLEISVSTLKREWSFAKLWLLREINRVI